jgi:hypothetical protein
VLLRNDTPRSGRHWLMLKLIGRAGASSRDPAGARVRCTMNGDDGRHNTLIRELRTSGSYLCTHDDRIHFGLGPAAVVPKIEIRWPDGSLQTLRNVAADQLLTVEQP